MSDKRELIDIAASLQSIVDRLLECAKEDKEEDEEDSKEEYSGKTKPHLGMIAMMLKKKLDK